MKCVKRSLTLTSVLLLLVNLVFAGGVLDSKLQQKMANEAGPFEVIVTFTSLDEVNSLSALGVTHHALTQLPMAGAVLTTSQINEVLGWNNVVSIYFNDVLEYSNYDAGQITGAHYVHNTLGIKGNGVTILVIDSGADATHPDLAFGTKVIQNVKIVSDLGTTGTVSITEGVINTDNTSGHGTHVSGTAAGSGAASAADSRAPNYYDGAAPAAKLVVLGAGEVLFILSALEAFDYALGNIDRYGTDIITNSWGNTNSNFDPANPINQASFEAYRRGLVVTFAAGNEGDTCPAGCDCENTMSSYAISPWVIGVAAGDKNKNLACFSSRGEPGDPFEHPDITAPGVSITSTRAPGTPVGALGPVIDPKNPLYTLYYHTISGTSMATPFVAGVVALLLEANPNLSPDQIEDIITSTADPMPYALHHVGAGYINVQAAVQAAQNTTGNRLAFLAGDTKWSSQGNWFATEQNDSDLAYSGQWNTSSANNASGGTYKWAKVSKGKSNPFLQITFFGMAIRLEYPTKSDGGVAEVVIDGQSYGNISYFSSATQWGKRTSFAGLDNKQHTLQLKALNGKAFIDKIYIDGALFPANTQFVDETTTFSATMPPSVSGTTTHTIQFQVSSNTIQISAELSWDAVADLDLYLLDPNGQQVASSASLANPESFTYWVTQPGTYTYEIAGFASVLTNYTLTSILTRAVPLSKQSSDDVAEKTLGTIPTEFAVFQNYPNPFNPETNITYHLPRDSDISLKVFDIRGREVATLVRGRQLAGVHRVRFDGKHLPSGIYFYKIEVSDIAGERFTKVNRMLLLK
ncbi:MAG: S8 family serine peptidase [bacterium]